MPKRKLPWMRVVERTEPEPKPLFGVFLWNAHGRYPRDKAVKIYKREAAAERFCQIRPFHVVRHIHPEP